MSYDFRNRTGSSYPMYGPPPSTTSSSSSTSSHHPMYGSPLYPRIGQQQGPAVVPPPVSRTSSYNQSPSPSSSGIGIRVALKPEYRITPPPPLSTQVGDIPRSNYHFDFDFEKRVLSEAEKDSQNWSRLVMENLPSKAEPTSSSDSAADPVVSRYVASGLNREAVLIAVTNYGDNPTKIREFANGYSVLREMGFTSRNVPEVLLMCDNDTDKALAQLLSGSA